MGIEPTRPAWKAGILAVELHPRMYFVISVLRLIRRLDYYISFEVTCQQFFYFFKRLCYYNNIKRICQQFFKKIFNFIFKEDAYIINIFLFYYTLFDFHRDFVTLYLD